jgi:hypothetical protein
LNDADQEAPDPVIPPELRPHMARLAGFAMQQAALRGRGLVVLDVRAEQVVEGQVQVLYLPNKDTMIMRPEIPDPAIIRALDTYDVEQMYILCIRKDTAPGIMFYRLQTIGVKPKRVLRRARREQKRRKGEL